MTTRVANGFSAPSILRSLEALGRAVVDILFPPHCVACRRYGSWLCADCVERIEVICPPVCPRCGMPFKDTSCRSPLPSHSALPMGALTVGHPPLVCGGCAMTASCLDGLRAYAFHDDPLREAIHQFKYQGLTALAPPLAELMARGWATLVSDHRDVDVIVPVPLHASRERQRGYNQSALLARELGAHLECSVAEDVLLRTRATVPQVGLTAAERQANVNGAFKCVKSSVTGKKVLLVDDVLTTGATLEAACAALRDTGVSSVWAYTLARAKPGAREGSQINGKESGKWN